MNNKLLKRYSVLFLLIFGMVSFSHGQSHDFATWTGIKMHHKFASDFTVNGKVELRTRDALKSVDRWGLSLSGAYTVLPFLKVDAGYELHYRDRGYEGWKFRNRYHVGATGTVAWQQFKFSLRERIQQTFEEGNAENRLRSRLKVAYSPDSWIVSPYFSVELYQALGNAPFFDVARMRYRPGVVIEFSKKWELDVFYCYQYEPDKKRHIIGLECGFTF